MLPNINALCADWARGTPHGDSSTAEALVTSTTTKPPDANREDCRRRCKWNSETFLVETPFSISQAKDLASSIEEIAIGKLLRYVFITNGHGATRLA
ncbi:metallo-beta-lactamase domain protein [Aspergillus luchuensis]|uniref:Metallo-beta-lactamase domain protein n=1 Tax=Aspergillus kawachii TaxID=1069201 RepID=A0A146FAL2_ASPKA|nr:metallo-beta-lactamase domain protein [Aspergillus luchuensis]